MLLLFFMVSSSFFNYCIRFITNWIVEYDTPRVITIRNKKFGLIYRFVQLSIIAYIIGYKLTLKTF